MTSSRGRRAKARNRGCEGPSASPPWAQVPGPNGTTHPAPDPTPPSSGDRSDSPPGLLRPSEASPNTSDSSLVILPTPGPSTTTTGTTWSKVVAGSPHSASAGPAVLPPTSLPQAGSQRGFALLAESDCTHGADDIAPSAPAGDHPPSIPPRPLDYEDFEFLLAELTALGNRRAEDLKIQNDRHTAYLAHMQSLDATLEKQTNIASGLMSAVSTLHNQLDTTRAEVVEANDLAYAVHNDLHASPTDPPSLVSKVADLERAVADIRASLSTTTPSTPSTPSTPLHTTIPEALATTHATVLESLANMGDDLAQHMDNTICTQQTQTHLGDASHTDTSTPTQPRPNR